MENNKLLIGAQFTHDPSNRCDGKPSIYHLELYVLRDITLQQLLDGIRYGLRKMINEQTDEEASDILEIYKTCNEIFLNCIEELKDSPNGKYYTHVTLSSYSGREHFRFYQSDLEKPLYKFGFVTSSRLVFDETRNEKERFRHLYKRFPTSNLTDAFAPLHPDSTPEQDKETSPQKISFPAYNISTRLLYQFDNKPVEIILPQDPPKKPRQHLWTMLLPSLVTLTVMLLVRTFLMGRMNGNTSYGLQMGLLSAAMGLTAVISTVFSWHRQNADYSAALGKWRGSYENYINDLMERMRERQQNDVKQLDALYPDMLTLIAQDRRGIYNLNSAVYSRSPQDEDFLTFRIGRSDQVKTLFEIKGPEKDVVFSEADFRLTETAAKSGTKDVVQLYLHNEGKKYEKEMINLHLLPSTIAKRYRFLKDAPLLYSLKNCGAVGIVDPDVERLVSENPSAANYFITRMIFELCYYHAPENLQFVILFPRKIPQAEIERLITHYKFMPHFRGLFSDRSQFVFDEQSASLIFSGLLTLMGQRQTSGTAIPHVLVVVYDEYSLKEHAFAEFLPSPPETGKSFENKLGLTFVYATKYQEYLPPYCDSVIRFEKRNAGKNYSGTETMTLTPRADISKRQSFYYRKWSKARSGGQTELDDFWVKTMKQTAYAFRFLSAAYYTRIAENGQVPSAVTLFELLLPKPKNTWDQGALERVVRENWGFGKSERKVDVTESLRVPIGRTGNLSGPPGEKRRPSYAGRGNHRFRKNGDDYLLSFGALLPLSSG